jgi:hypothetical protein
MDRSPEQTQSPRMAAWKQSYAGSFVLSFLPKIEDHGSQIHDLIP